LAGDRETGVTAFQLDAGMDTGPIWSQAHTVIEPRENAGDLLERLTQLGISVLLEALPKALAGIQRPIDQPADGVTLASKLTRDLARVNFTRDAVNVESLIRAMNPEPMSWALWRDEPIQLLEAVSLGPTDWASLGLSEASSEPGSIALVSDRVVMRTGGGTLLELKQVKPAGKQAMAARDWCRGFHRESDWMLR
jgi:methionyl-tRNA formyltransferase